MAQEPREPAGVIIGTPMRYAGIAVARRLGANLPTYLVLAVAVAMPCVALLFRSVIRAQGDQLGGADTARIFDAATGLIAAIAILVGLLQASLVLGRALAQRSGEYRLLAAIVMRPGEILQVTLWESAFHAAIGWLTGSIATFVTIALFATVLDFPVPTAARLMSVVAASFVTCLLAVVVPSVIDHARRARSDSSYGQAT